MLFCTYPLSIIVFVVEMPDRMPVN